jgi:group I intron endonuclease
MGYIYSIINKTDNKKYIGQTLEKDIYNRWKGHLKKASNCIYLKRALEKYGKENFKFDIICVCFDEDCNKYEQEYMDKYDTIVPNGYNLRKAGNNGAHNEETKIKISNILKLRYQNLTEEQKKKNKGVNNGMFGKQLSQEAKDNLSKKMKENWEKGVFKRENLTCRKKVNCYSLDNEYISSYDSITDVVNKLGELKITKPEISMCCNNKRKTAKGFIWKFENTEINLKK